MYNFILYAFKLNIFTKNSHNHENHKFLYVGIFVFVLYFISFNINLKI